jgi:hypothetical protein
MPTWRASIGSEQLLNLPADDHVPRVAAVAVNSGQDLQQSRLAGAVLAAQPHDFARAHRHARAAEGAHASETFLDSSELERGHFLRNVRITHGRAVIFRYDG